jgi:hypothetical protein
MGVTLKMEVVEDMFSAYQETQSAQHVHRETGVHWSTAKKYIEGGDQGRGIEPFSTRLAKIRRIVEDKTDYDVAKAIVDNLEVIRPLKAELVDLLRQQVRQGRRTVRTLYDKDGEKVLAKQTTAAEIEAKVGDIYKLVKLELSLLGEPDEVIELRIKAIAGLFFALMRAEGIDDEKIVRIAERVDELGSGAMDQAARKAS